MKMFVTSLIDKEVMTNDGEILGIIENVLVDTKTGALQTIVIAPAEEVDVNKYQTDEEGRILIPFEKFHAKRDVVVVKVD